MKSLLILGAGGFGQMVKEMEEQFQTMYDMVKRFRNGRTTGG